MMKWYEKYKASSLFAIEKLPEHWTEVRLKNIGILYGGLSGKSGDDFSKEENQNYKPYIPFKNIAGNLIIDNFQLDYVIVHPNEKQNRVLKGDLLFLMSSENYDDIGKTSVYLGEIDELYLNSFCKGFRPKPDKVNSKFLNYLLNADEFRKGLSKEAKGFTRINLQIGKIENLGICLPPLPEQTQIAAFLDHQTGLIDALIAKKEALIEKLKLQRQAIINEAVTKGLDPKAKMKDSGIEWLGQIPEDWEAKRLKYIFRIQKRIAGELGYDVLSVTQRGLKVKDLEDFSGQHSMDYSKYQIVIPGDFVMNHMDLLTGFVDISSQVGVTSPDYRVFELIDNRCNPKYFLYLNQMCYAEKIFYAHGQGVSTLGRWRLQSKEFNNMRFPFPSFEKQNEIVSFLDQELLKMERLSLKLQNFIEKLKQYRQSLISEAVTGKIDVREWKPKSKAALKSME